MEFFEYLTEFEQTIRNDYPNKENRTVEQYLATFSALPPTLEEFFTPKCALEAQYNRLNGNKMFAEERYKEAAIWYTKSVKKSPPYSKSSALAYANRSAAFYRLKEYEECVSDIDRALDLPYPYDLRVKIISRKESALSILNETKNNNNNNNKKNNNNEIDDSLKITHGESEKLLGASRGIDVTVKNNQEGRIIVAKMAFQPGDVLVVEKPYLIVSEPVDEPTYCNHCLKNTLCLVPCEQCSEEMYCSLKCRNEAYENYHRTECKMLFTLISNDRLNVRSLICQLRCLNILTEQGTNLKSFYEDFKDAEENSDSLDLGFTGDRSVENTRKAFLSFVTDKKTERNNERMFATCYIVYLLRNYTDFFQNNADVPIVAKLLMKLSEACALNYFVISYSEQLDPKARATFPLIGWIKHACVNNTVAYIDKNGRLVLRASQYIRPGDQIQYNYCDSQYSIAETLNGSGKKIQCIRNCITCEKSYTYLPERLQPNVKMDKRLRSKLQENPYDIEALWKVLNLARGKHQHYTPQAQMIKAMIAEAYEGRVDHVDGHSKLQMFKIL